MKKVIFILLFGACHAIYAQDIFSLSKLTDHVKGVVFTWRNGFSSSGKDDSYFFAQSFGFSLLIRPDNIDPPNGYNGSDFVWKMEDSVYLKRDNCTKDTCWKMKQEIKSPFTLALGYEFAPAYMYLVDERESHFQIKGYYAGFFWHPLHFPREWLGATVELCTISDATGAVRDNSGNYIPIKYSTETTLAPEVYVGGNLSRFIFIDFSWQYIHFSSITYRQANDGSYISTISNARLKNNITINSFLLTIGVNIAGNLFH